MASGSTATASISSSSSGTTQRASGSFSSSMRTRTRPDERLEVRLRPRLLPVAIGQQGKHLLYDGLDFFKQQPDHKAKAQRMPGATADCKCESSLLYMRMCIHDVPVHMLICLSGHGAF